MSFGGIQFLQIMFSGQAIVYQSQLCNLFLAEYINLMLLCGYLIMNIVSIPFIFI